MGNKNFMATFCLVAALALALAAGCAPQTQAPPPGNQAQAAPGPLPESIAPVLVLEGGEYEMGYQYGFQGAARIVAYKNRMLAQYTGENSAWGYTRAELAQILQGFQVYLREYTPELIDFFQGMSDGSTAAGYPLSYSEALLMQFEWELWTITLGKAEQGYPAQVDSLPPSSRCTNFAAWGRQTTHGQLVSFFNCDAEFRDQASLIYLPSTGNSFIACQADFGYLNFSWLQNEKGLYIGMTFAPSDRPEDNQYGLGIQLGLYRLARFCNTAKEAVDMLLATKTTTGWNYIIADPGGDVYAVETTGAHKVVRRSGDHGEQGDFIAAANHFISEEMQVSQNSPASGSATSVARYAQVFNALNKSAGKVDLEFAMRQARSAPVCRAATKMVNIGVAEAGQAPRTYVCTGTADWGNGGSSLGPIDPTFSFYEIALESSPAAIAETAKATAEDELRAAHGELYKLTYADPAFVPLKDLVSQAKSEYYWGRAALDEAKIAGVGDERRAAVFKYSEALTHFTRAQALAQQAYNALRP